MRPSRNASIVVVVAGISQLMVVLDGTIVNIALPAIQADLGFDDAYRAWVVASYAAAFGGLLLLGGRLSDRIGRKRSIIIGLFGFAAASVMGGLALNLPMLVVARVLQGAFAALLAPSVLALMSDTFREPRARARAFGVFGAVVASGSAVGLLLGGALTEFADWRWCFFVNLIFVAVVLPFTTRLAGGRGAAVGRLDLVGATAVTAAMFALVVGLTNAEVFGWLDAVTVAFLAAAAVSFGLFVLRLLRTTSPLVPPSLVRDRERAGALATMGLAALGMAGLQLQLTFFIQQELALSPFATGLTFLSLTGGIVVGSMLLVPRLVPRFGIRTTLITGSLLSAAGMAGLCVAGAAIVAIVCLLALVGVGMGTLFATATPASTIRVPPSLTGVAGATLSAVQQVGGAVGVALILPLGAALAPVMVPGNTMDSLYAGSFLGAACALLLAAVLARTVMPPAPRL